MNFVRCVNLSLAREGERKLLYHEGICEIGCTIRKSIFVNDERDLKTVLMLPECVIRELKAAGGTDMLLQRRR